MKTIDPAPLDNLAKRIRYLILTASTQAGSGHPTSALSSVELITALLFGGIFRYDPDQPSAPGNDRLIFSKGHATPLFYSLWVAAGKLTETDLMAYRRFESMLEGHPSVAFPYTEAATGSLGQGLSIGLGMALNAQRLDRTGYRTYVLLGDSEMAEGSQWEAVQLAAHYGLGHLTGILDVNRLGQCGPTMLGRDTDAYRDRLDAFGWHTRVVDGHALPAILDAYRWAAEQTDRPAMIIAATVKGKGVSFLEDRNGWHGKALDKDSLQTALDELGNVEHAAHGQPAAPPRIERVVPEPRPIESPVYEAGASIPTRDAYGNALRRIYPKFPDIVVLDGEVSNSTRSERFKEAWPERFFEMFIAEQNMVGTALGMALRGRHPFVSTFAAFFTRAFDQIRMAQYSRPNLKFAGSHAGVSIGEDGPSQMGLEDIAMFRSLLHSVVLYPCDAVSTERLVERMAEQDGIAYLRTTRGGTPVIYDTDETFTIGGSKVLRRGNNDRITLAAAGITVHESLAAAEQLTQRGIPARVIDLYSVKPLDTATLRSAARETGGIVTVEDHYPAGGLGEAVSAALADRPARVHRLAVCRRPKSGSSRQLLEYEGISADAIVATVEKLIKPRPTPGGPHAA